MPTTRFSCVQLIADLVGGLQLNPVALWLSGEHKFRYNAPAPCGGTACGLHASPMMLAGAM